MPTQIWSRITDDPVTHLDDGQGGALCGNFRDGDSIITETEAYDLEGKHYDCPNCNWAHGGFRDQGRG